MPIFVINLTYFPAKNVIFRANFPQKNVKILKNSLEKYYL